MSTAAQRASRRLLAWNTHVHHPIPPPSPLYQQSSHQALWNTTCRFLLLPTIEHRLNITPSPTVWSCHESFPDGIIPPGCVGFYGEVQHPGIDKTMLQTIEKEFKQQGKKKKSRVALWEVKEWNVMKEFIEEDDKVRWDWVKDTWEKQGRVFLGKWGDVVELWEGLCVEELGGKEWAVDALKVMGVNDMQRVAGTAFFTREEFGDWEKRTKDAMEHDHRIVGGKQKLFMFHEASPGSVFWLKHGAIIQSRLIGMLRDEYAARGFDEVATPQLFKTSLWATSGHLEHYAKDMFFLDSHTHNDDHEHNHSEHDILGLKPMNCPSHCLIYASEGTRSYKSLPVRLADFGALHRNELSGALGGLTRLRRFHQDDAHIFCAEDQISSEIASCLDFLDLVYRQRFGFQVSVRLSTRPTKSAGVDDIWERAEQALRDALSAARVEWALNPGDGAFYGPKIDVAVKDRLGRQHQCGTIQLDFVLPERFKLEFRDANGVEHRPVMIHRAVLGSLERFVAILLEHTGGKLPFWLTPRQVCVVPVTTTDDALNAYAEVVRDTLRESPGQAFRSSHTAGFAVDVDLSNETLNKRVRNAQQAPYAVIIVVGARERLERTVSVRLPGWDGESISMSLEDFVRICCVSHEGRINETFPEKLLETVK